MKKQLKILSIIVIMVFGLGTALYAQELSFGIRAGFDMQNINGKDADGDKLENTLLPGFNAGINVEIPVAPDFVVQPGLLFTTKGSELAKYDGNIIEGSAKLHLSYIELPINFIYKPLLGTGHLILGFGPYLAYGVGGKFKIDGSLGSLEYHDDWDVKFQNEVKSGDPIDQYYVKPFDAGANFLFGYELENGLSTQLNAQWGLLELRPDYGVDTKATMKNTGFGISLGYRF